MDRVEVSAPGKLVLIGEYAVLFGAPASVAAVDRRAVVTLSEAAAKPWEVMAPGLAPAPAFFDLGPDGAVRWQDEAVGRTSFGFVEKLFGAMKESGAIKLTSLPPLTVILDTQSFFESSGGGAKLGLGSSAALTVALAAALEAWAAEGDPTQAGLGGLQRLVGLHRTVQGGAGSGIDVAASLLGGVVRYRLDDTGTVAEAASMTLPEELRMVFVWTGRAASTGDLLARLDARLEEAPGTVRPALDELGSVSSDGVTALDEDRVSGFLDAVDVFWEAFEQLGEAIGKPILSAEHRALRRLAAGRGVHYKPSGAGGGDLGIGFTTDASAAVDFADRVASEGFQVIDLRIDGMGVAGPGR